MLAMNIRCHSKITLKINRLCISSIDTFAQRNSLQVEYLRHRHGSGGVSCVGPRALLGMSFRPTKLISDDVKRFVVFGLCTIGSLLFGSADVMVFSESSSTLNAKRKYAFTCHANKHVKTATLRLRCVPTNILLFYAKNSGPKIY